VHRRRAAGVRRGWRRVGLRLLGMLHGHRRRRLRRLCGWRWRLRRRRGSGDGHRLRRGPRSGSLW
jgi:hypothetical protein